MREDWIECELGDVLIQSKEKHKPDNVENIFYVGLEHIQKSTGTLTENAGVEKIKTIKNKFSKGQILYGKLRPYLNKVYLAKENGVCSTDILVLNVNNNVEDKYALHYMLNRKFVNEMSANTCGVNLPRVSTNYVITYKFPLAPLPIQRAIVSKIEELFSDLDKGIADLKRAQAQLKVYRQAVLKKAFEGDWTLKKLEEVSDAVGGYAFKSNTFLEEGKFQVIRIGNVRPGVIRYTASPVFVNEVDEKVLERYHLKVNDIVISLTGTRTKRDYGFTSLISTDNLLLNQRLAYIRFTEEYLPKFFLYYSWSEPFKVQFFGSETGNTGQGNVGMKSVKETLVPLPSKEEQHQIVREIESRLSVCDKVEQCIEESLEKSKALRQSILKQAFEGRLLSATEIERCKQEKDYEPAHKLLEHIKQTKK